MKIKLYSKKWGKLPLAESMYRTPDDLIFPGAQFKVAHSDPKDIVIFFSSLKPNL